MLLLFHFRVLLSDLAFQVSRRQPQERNVFTNNLAVYTIPHALFWFHIFCVRSLLIVLCMVYALHFATLLSCIHLVSCIYTVHLTRSLNRQTNTCTHLVCVCVYACMCWFADWMTLLCFRCDVIIPFLFSFPVIRVFFLCSCSVSVTDITSLELAC